MSALWMMQKIQKIRSVLMKFLGDVILVRDENDAKRFYPRFNLMETTSFAAYDPTKHDLLKQLHDGYYYKNHMEMWADCARRTIPALMQSTDMLMCGEDLGFVPACVPPVMHELGVIGLRIQRMPGPEAVHGVNLLQIPPACICCQIHVELPQLLVAVCMAANYMQRGCLRGCHGVIVKRFLAWAGVLRSSSACTSPSLNTSWLALRLPKKCW